jgi:hypothetical protein
MPDTISLFAVFFILAQAIERIVELISESEYLILFKIPMFFLSHHRSKGEEYRSKGEKQNFLEEKKKIDEYDRKIKDWQKIVDNSIDKLIDKITSDINLQNTIKKYQQDIVDAENQKNKKEMERIVGLWFWASVLGLALCLVLNIGFLKTIGMPIPPGFDTLDYVVSAIVVGSGTKPLHDIIGYIEKAKA